MITEDKKYISSILKTFGFAFFTPIGSIFFQLLVFKKNVFDSLFFFSLSVSIAGILALYYGYNMVKENNNEQ